MSSKGCERPEGHRPPRQNRRNNKLNPHPHGTVKGPVGWGYLEALKKLHAPQKKDEQ